MKEGPTCKTMSMDQNIIEAWVWERENHQATQNTL